MPQLLPFAGLRYTAAAGELDAVLAPPYDVISPAQHRALLDRSPYNAVRLELAEGGEERYAAVAALVEAWQADGVIARDEVPMLYVYEQRFVEEGAAYQRRALLCEIEAQPWDEGAVKPHEFTMSGPKEDRLKLLEATGIQFSPVFMIARDRAGQLRQFLDETIASREPDVAARSIDGDEHRLWLVEAGRLEMRRLAPLLSESFTIADGHHRYETHNTYKQRRLEREGTLPRDHPARFAMTAVVAVDDPGLVIRPIHRIVPREAPADWRERLAGSFTIEPAADRTAAEAAVRAEPSAIAALGLEGGGAAVILRPIDEGVAARLAPPGQSEAWTRIPPNLLRYGVLGPLWAISDDDLRAGVVEYTHVADEVIERVEASGACGFLLHPVGVREVIALADQGERMPQKSTFFHPKLGTGLVFHPLSP